LEKGFNIAQSGIEGEGVEHYGNMHPGREATWKRGLTLQK
jgi:hypothetical protein